MARSICCPRSPGGVTQGAQISIEVTPRGDPRHGAVEAPACSDHRRNSPPRNRTRRRSSAFPSPDDRLEPAGWSDLLEDARSGIVRFPGGELRVSPHSGDDADRRRRAPASQLAMAGAEAAAATRSFVTASADRSASTFRPSRQGRAPGDRRGGRRDPAAAVRTDRRQRLRLPPDRAPAPRASLFELAADRAAFEARALLRRAALERQGATALAAHPAVIRVLEQRPTWIEQLSRQVGGAVTLRSDASLPIHGGLCARRLIPSPVPSAASRRLRSMPLSAPAAARIATCCAGSAEGYRIPGPAADPAGVDSEESDR